MGQVIFTFPEWKQTDSTTSLVLKSPKTESSVRKVYLPRTVALALREVKSSQDALKLLIGDEYADYGLVIAHEDGRPYEERQIAALLRKLIAENDLRPVVFHSLRHCSASLKLQIGGGNIKAVNDSFEYIHVNYNPRKAAGAEAVKKAESLMKRLNNPARFGFPVFVVLDEKGTVLHIQDSSFLEEGKGYDEKKVLRFLKNWTPKAVK